MKAKSTPQWYWGRQLQSALIPQILRKRLQSLSLKNGRTTKQLSNRTSKQSVQVSIRVKIKNRMKQLHFKTKLIVMLIWM